MHPIVSRLSAPRLYLLFLSTAMAAAAAAPAVAQPAAGATAATGDISSSGIIAAVRQAADAYAAAFNSGNEAALGDQWTLGAELEEGGDRLKGRGPILGSLMRWRAMHPDASLKIEVTGVEPLGEAVARVRGSLSFSRRAGEPAAVSEFDSLRVLEGGVWRIAESRVVPTAKSALADLDWMLGTWQSTDAQSGSTVDATYEKSLGGHAIVGRIKTTRKDGSTVESLDVIHADRLTGMVRSTIIDSTGSQARGVFSSDGTSFNRSLVGTPGDAASGVRAEWVQVLAPLGNDMVLWHSIERTIDGRPLADTQPVHLRRIR